jgi:hypothetical protein
MNQTDIEKASAAAEVRAPNDCTIPIETVRQRRWNIDANRRAPITPLAKSHALLLERIGQAGEVLELVEPFNAVGCNCFVSRYVYTKKCVISRNRMLSFVEGGWHLIGRAAGGFIVGVWLMHYCGPEVRQ